MQNESKPTNEPPPKPKRTLEDFYRETRAERDLIAARRRLQDSLNQKQGGPPMSDEGKSKKPEPPKPDEAKQPGSETPQQHLERMRRWREEEKSAREAGKLLPPDQWPETTHIPRSSIRASAQHAEQNQHDQPSAAFYRETRAERAKLSGTAPEMIFMPGLPPESYEREKRKSPPLQD